MSQKRQRRALSGDEKMGILREHLVEGRPVSELCDKHNLQPTQVYQWLRRRIGLWWEPTRAPT